MKALNIARKSMLEMLREIQLFGLVIALPMIFLLIGAFGYNTPLQRTYAILMLNELGIEEGLIHEIEEQKFDSGKAVFSIQVVEDKSTGLQTIQEQSASLLVEISLGSTGSPQINLIGDALNMQYYRASTILNRVINAYYDRMQNKPEVVRINEESIVQAGVLTEYDIYAPGIIIFGREAPCTLIPSSTATITSNKTSSLSLAHFKFSFKYGNIPASSLPLNHLIFLIQ